MGNRLVLAVNPGSTSTKLALYDADKQLFEKTLRHTSRELEGFKRIVDQLTFRHDIIMEALEC